MHSGGLSYLRRRLLEYKNIYYNIGPAQTLRFRDDHVRIYTVDASSSTYKI